MDGYEGDPEATGAAVDGDGWLRSGDLGVLSADGYVTLTGRVKDLIIKGGENIAPASVEDAIRQHVPGVGDVSVIGVPDSYYGEEIAAYVRPASGADLTEAAIREYLYRTAARFTIPKYIRIVHDFPTTPSGKIQKYRLREQFAAEKTS